ncbi:MAG: DUF2029 domain-containing protein [Chloroflexi bacterium]|nr:DUF2029 domain-containing protein [Chloroflexota bacterium]
MLISSLQLRWPIRQPGVFLSLVLLFPPLRDELNEAQVGLLLFVLVCGAWYCHVKGWDVGAGALVGVAAAIKIFPIVALVFFGWRRRYRTVVAALATVTVLTVVGIALTGVTPLVRYFGAVLPSLRSWYGHFNNQSLVGLFTRFLAEGPFTSPWADVPWLAFALSALAVSGIAVLTLLGWTRLAREPLDPPLAFSLALLAMLLMSPITWSHYLVFAYFPLLTLVASLERTRPFSWRRFDLVLIVYVLLSVPSAIVVDPQTLDLPVVGLLAQTLASWGYEPGQRVGGLALVLSLGKVSGLLLAFGLTWSLLGPRRSPEHLPTGGASLAAKGTRQA